MSYRVKIVLPLPYRVKIVLFVSMFNFTRFIHCRSGLAFFACPLLVSLLSLLHCDCFYVLLFSCGYCYLCCAFF
jgi:hypothetical protein